MLGIHIICVGRLKEKFYIDAAEEYQKRLSHLCRLNITELNEERLPDRPSRAQIDAALSREAVRIETHLPRRDNVTVALCIEGQLLSSEAFAAKIADRSAAGVSHVSFVIGGSYGLDAALKARADLRLSLSRMTFPHHLARVMLLEQIYRAFQINEGTRYHK